MVKQSRRAMTRRSTLCRRHFFQRVIALAAIACSSRQPWSQEIHPIKPARIIVPYSSGGSADTICRMVFGRVSETIGRQFIIDNRPGGGGAIGAAAVARSAPDGYTPSTMRRRTPSIPHCCRASRSMCARNRAASSSYVKAGAVRAIAHTGKSGTSAASAARENM